MVLNPRDSAVVTHGTIDWRCGALEGVNGNRGVVLRLLHLHLGHLLIALHMRH